MQMKALLTTSLLLFVPAAFACPGPPHASTDACLSWSAPTQNTDGSPITQPLTYRVYRDGVLAGTTGNLYLLLAKEPAGQRCYYVTAVEAGIESAPSGTGCKMIRPAAPTDGSIEAPTDGSFEQE